MHPPVKMVQLVKISHFDPRQQPAFFYMSLAAIFARSAIMAVEFTVEEYAPRTSRHFHHMRHARANRSTPYKSDITTTIIMHSDQYDTFSLSCPHVTDANNNNVQIEVTWTLNDTIWLKVEDGEKKIYNQLTTFRKKSITGKTVLRVLLNNGRYFFDYDELVGDFSMEIRPVRVEEDAGVWQCHVTVYQEGNTHTLTSRSRVKVPHGHRPHYPHLPADSSHYSYLSVLKEHLSLELKDKDRNKITSFTRTNQGILQINRDETQRTKMVVFDRQEISIVQSQYDHTSKDYEMSVKKDEESPSYSPYSRARGTYSRTSSLCLSLMTARLFIFYVTQ